MDFDSIAVQAGVALLGLLLYVLAWRSVGKLPAALKWTLRLLLAAAILVPFALIATMPMMESARDGARDEARPRYYKRTAPAGDRERDVAARPSPGAPSTPPRPATPPEAYAPEEAAPPSAPRAPDSGPTAGAAPDASSPAAPDGGPRTRGLGRPDTAPGPASANGEPRSAEPSGGSGPPTSRDDRLGEAAKPAPAAGAGVDTGDWTVVPVYYGTDRELVPNDKRLDYGSARARKLQLGRALVTVPKAHEVPQIERPWAITIPYFKVKIYEQKEDPKKHFTMQELKALSEAELVALVKERLAASARFKDHAFVFVHGYNTTFDNAVYRAAQIAYDIKFDGAPFVYSWPSGGGIASYTYDRESASQAEPYLGDFLKLVTEKTGARHVSLIAHSMGNQLLLRVLQDMQRRKPEDVKISQIILAAPDVDRDAFENIAGSLKGLATGVTLYAAANDRALDVSRRFHGGIPRAGDVPGGMPLVVPGIDTIDATAVSMDSLGLHHSGYAESNALLSDIGLLIQTGERPPEKRVPILKVVPTDKGPFWRYP